MLTKNEFYEKFKDVKFYFADYEKFTFHFEGKDENGRVVRIGVGGGADEVYLIDIARDIPDNIYNLEPYYGLVYGDLDDKFC